MKLLHIKYPDVKVNYWLFKTEFKMMIILHITILNYQGSEVMCLCGPLSPKIIILDLTLQWTAGGTSGRNGGSALSRARMGYVAAREFATTLHPCVVAHSALTSTGRRSLVP